MVLGQIFLSFPGGFVLRVAAPLNFAKLDKLAASDSAGKLENLNWFLLVGQIVIQLNSFQWHCVSQRYVSHLRVALLQLRNVELLTIGELLTILRVIPTCRPLLPYAPKLDMVLQIVALTSL